MSDAAIAAGAAGGATAAIDVDLADVGAFEPADPSAEAMKCAADAAYFIDTCLQIEDTQGEFSGEGGVSGGGSDAADGAGRIPFRLWAAQVQVIWTLMVDRLVVILKARQLGISWVVVAFVLWHVGFHGGKTALLYSQGQEEANELLRRLRFLYDSMAPWLRARFPTIVQENMSFLAFSNGSRVRCLPATERAGRSWTASLVVLDEAAHLQYGGKLYTSLKPTIGRKGQLIVLSTANGYGGLFHWLWTKAVAGQNGFRAIFLPWWARPGRDRAWYAEEVRQETDPGKVKQEYPANPVEAFRASGRTRFHPDWVEAQVANLRDPIPEGDLPEALRAVAALAGPGNLRVYALPTMPPLAPRRVVIGADVAEGLERGDYSDACVLDADAWEELASLNGHWEPDEYAALLEGLRACYGAEQVGVERNNHGHAALLKLKVLGCPAIGTGFDGRPGWLTTERTKPLMIDLLATALREGEIAIRDASALGELQVYRTLANGSTGAPCFPPGTLILTSQCRVTVVDRVESNHSIITHKGEARAVTETMERDYSGDLVGLKVSGMPAIIEATPEHPFWGRRRTCKWLQKRATRKKFPSEWVEAGELKSGDWLAVPKRVGLPPTPLSVDQLYAIGFWLAEGHMLKGWSGDDRGLGLTNTNREWIEKAAGILEGWFPTDRVKRGNARGTWTVEQPSKGVTMPRQRGSNKPAFDYEFRSRDAAEFFRANFGEKSHGKFIGPEIFGRSGLLPLVTPFIDGEGSQRKNQQGDVDFTTTSESLAWQMRQILLDSGIWCTLRKATRKPFLRKSDGKRVESPRPAWAINIKASYLHLLTGCKVVTPEGIRHTRHVMEDDECFYAPVRGVTRRHYEGKVYNLAVDGDNSYVAGGVAVHNCGYHDDRVMSRAIALMMARRPKPRELEIY